MNMKIEFIPVDYDYFDFEGRNYAKIIGRDSKGKRVCIIDSCDVYFWAILKDKLSEIEKRRGYDLGFISHYIIEKKLNPLCWYEIEGEVLSNSLEFGGIDSSLDVSL